MNERGTMEPERKGNGGAPPPSTDELLPDLPHADLSHSIEAEQAVLGGLLLDNTALARIIEVLSADDFYRADHRVIFQQMVDLIEDDQPADALTVAEALERAGKLADVGGQAYLGALAANTPSAANIRRYADIVRERAGCRAAAGIGRKLADAMGAPGTDIEAALAEARTKLDTLPTMKRPRTLDWAALAARNPEPPQFIVPDWLPCGYATLLAGHGGVGKSAIGLDLATCIALGLPFAGIPCAPRRVFYYCCEDRENIIAWRERRICLRLGIGESALVRTLYVDDMVGDDTILIDRNLAPTRAYAALVARSEVKCFVNHMLRFIPIHGALLLIGHVNRLAAANPDTREGYTGSTQWHNAVRARWYLHPGTETDDGEKRARSTGRLLLELQKSNNGPIDQSTVWRWDDQARMFLPEPAPTLFDRKHAKREEQRGILLALKACAASSITVPAATTGNRTAYHVISAQPTFPATLRTTAGRRRFWAQIEKMRAMRLIRDGSIRRKSDRHEVCVLVLTESGMRACGK